MPRVFGDNANQRVDDSPDEEGGTATYASDIGARGWQWPPVETDKVLLLDLAIEIAISGTRHAEHPGIWTRADPSGSINFSQRLWISGYQDYLSDLGSARRPSGRG